MQVLQINQSDVSGGAAIAGYRLHQGLLDAGIDSRLLVGNMQTDSDRVALAPISPLKENLLFRASNRLLNTNLSSDDLGLNYINISGSFDIPKHPFYKNADILNFHNLHTGYFNYLSIPKLTENKPAIFTLHDMWSFTGHCAYSFDCDRWKVGCGKCPYPNTYPEVKHDSTWLEWKLKDWVFSRSNLTIVTPSRWLAEQSKASMLRRFPIHHIPNGSDMSSYQPLDSGLSRRELGLPENKKILLFGVESLKDLRKGGDLLLEALQRLPETLKSEIVLLTFGYGGEAIAASVGVPTLNLGYISSDRIKAIAYSASDLFLFPTRNDNLPLVLQESMACGTPMVSFKIGGVPELVRPDITGYLAQPEDARDFCNGIMHLLEDKEKLQQLRQNCRQIAVDEYSIERQVKRYINLYHQVLER
ncbi:glycosyltransferase family 4 protein [Pseudanabaena sp. PCC 6802]|uniref:glycosyltransferase family 4 protein n=1 Tax=Pseudanabaena sp. PCC 6802 TaxID=118173 RepID=UPI00034B1588|nr:glycosyltransferase family 4 protein [Pseudanabaena sp. PCC 6802]